VPALKLAVQLKSLRLPLRAALQAAARMGVSAVEIDARGLLRPQELGETGLRQFRKLLDDLGLRVSAVGFATRRGYSMLDELERRVAATKEAMDFARRLGADLVVNAIGRVPHEAQGPEWDLLLQVLSDLGRHGDRVGTTLAAETGSESGPDLARLLAALPSGSLGVTLDPGNLLTNGYDPLEAVASLGSWIRYVHAKDAVRDLSQGRGVEVPLGRGSVDFPALLGALEERDYRGYFCVERERADDPLREVQDSLEYLRNL
jgi:sugar phosphate isomerase/epimerase